MYHLYLMYQLYQLYQLVYKHLSARGLLPKLVDQHVLCEAVEHKLNGQGC